MTVFDHGDDPSNNSHVRDEKHTEEGERALQDVPQSNLVRARVPKLVHQRRHKLKVPKVGVRDIVRPHWTTIHALLRDGIKLVAHKTDLSGHVADLRVRMPRKRMRIVPLELVWRFVRSASLSEDRRTQCCHHAFVLRNGRVQMGNQLLY